MPPGFWKGTYRVHTVVLLLILRLRQLELTETFVYSLLTLQVQLWNCLLIGIEDIHKLRFFLQKNGVHVKAIIYPASSPFSWF